MPIPTGHRWTREEVQALPDDGQRYELVDGELLVTPAPRRRHQLALAELFVIVDPYVRAHGIGTTLFSPADFDMGGEHLVQPDLFVERRRAPGSSPEWAASGVPLLVAEIVSPSSARADRITKRRLYQRAGVGTCWVVDLDAELVETWIPGSEQPIIAERTLAWRPDATLPALEIDLPCYFAVGK